MLADVAERLLHDAEERDLLGVGQRRDVSIHREFHVDARAPLECVDFVPERVLERLLDGARRTNRVRDVAQAAIERAEPCLEIVEPTAHRRAVRVVEHGGDLVARVAQVVR